MCSIRISVYVCLCMWCRVYFLGGIKRSRFADCEQEDECLGTLIVISCTWFQKFSKFLSWWPAQFK